MSITTGMNDITKTVEHHALTVHTLLWHELKSQIYAVRDVLRQKDLLYDPDVSLPENLMWAVLGFFGSSRLTIEDNRWFVTQVDRRTKRHGRRVEIPAEFIGAPTSTCRALARRTIAEHELRCQRDAEIQQPQHQPSQPQAA